MRVIILNILIFGTIRLFGQVDSKDLILTQEQNENWFGQLGQSELKDQIELINKRILADTNVFVPNRTDRYIAENLNGRFPGYCKPIIVAGGVIIYIENRTRPTDLKQLTKLINTKTVKSIEIFSGDKATALYGSRGECNVVIVDIRQNSTKKKIKKLDDQMHPPTVTREIRWRH